MTHVKHRMSLGPNGSGGEGHTLVEERDTRTLASPNVTRRSFIGTGAALGATAGLAACQGSVAKPAATDAPRPSLGLAIVHTNDVHGHVEYDDVSLGLAAVAKLREQLEGEGYEVLLFDAGDAVQGTNVVNLHQGDTAIEFMNAIGYDALTLGNHEFDYGPDHLDGYRAAATFPLLSANVIVAETGKTRVDAHTTFTLKDGRKLGVFGLTTPETSTKANPLFVKGLSFLAADDLYACAQREVDALRAEGCDLVVCMAHLGEHDESAPNRARDVVAHVSGIDLVIDGHDHKEEEQVLKDASGHDTLVVESECHSHMVGIVYWGPDGALEHRFVRHDDTDAQDGEVAAPVHKAVEETEESLTEVVASTPFELYGYHNPGVRTEETNMGDFVADALLWKTQLVAEDSPNLALVNGGTIRDSLAAGDITEGGIVAVLPFINELVTIEVTGHELLEAFETSCSLTPKSLGGFPQVAGITYTIDTTVPFEEGEAYEGSVYHAPAKPGSRVRIDEVDGEPFDEDKTYVLATIDFVSGGGDTYHVFLDAAARSQKDCGVTLRDSFRDYLTDGCQGEVPGEYEKPQGRITVKL